MGCLIKKVLCLQVDPFHTVFGLAGLSLLGERKIKEVNPVFCMSQDVIKRIGIKVEILKM